MPRSAFGPYTWPSAATHTMSGFVGCTRTRADLLASRRGRRSVHVLPASVVLNTPSPCDTLPRIAYSPVPTYTMSGFDCAHRDRADRAAEVLVARRRPGVAAVRGLEHAAAGGAHPVLVGPRRRAGDGDGAAAAKDPDLAPHEPVPRHGVLGDRAGIGDFLCAERTGREHRREHRARGEHRHGGATTGRRVGRQRSLGEGEGRSKYRFARAAARPDGRPPAPCGEHDAGGERCAARQCG